MSSPTYRGRWLVGFYFSRCFRDSLIKARQVSASDCLFSASLIFLILSVNSLLRLKFILIVALLFYHHFRGIDGNFDIDVFLFRGCELYLVFRKLQEGWQFHFIKSSMQVSSKNTVIAKAGIPKKTNRIHLKT
jgi:hypothetical protein